MDIYISMIYKDIYLTITYSSYVAYQLCVLCMLLLYILDILFKNTHVHSIYFNQYTQADSTLIQFESSPVVPMIPHVSYME